MMERIHEGLQKHIGGDRAGARAWFSLLWQEIGADGDPLHRVALAHHMADVQESAEDELAWDLLALEAADSLTDERAKEYHATLAVQGFYPSLHLNLAEDHRKLGNRRKALEQLAAAKRKLTALGEGEYADGIRAAVDGLADRLGVLVRVAEPDELAGLLAVEAASDAMFTGVEFPPGSVLDDPDPTHTVLVVGRPAVGFVVTGPVDDGVHVHQISVRPEHGRRGVGGALLAEAVARAGRGVTVTLTTYADIPWNAPWYRRHGFSVLPEAEWGPGLREIVAAEKAAGLEELAGPRVAMAITAP